MQAPDQPILNILNTYASSAFEKDVDAHVGLYAGDVHAFDLWGKWSYNGAGEWRQMVVEWFDSLGSERVGVEFDDVQTLVTAGMAVVHAFVRYRALSAEEAELRAMTNQLTMVLKETNGAWKIVHQHTSAPIDATSGKVVFQR